MFARSNRNLGKVLTTRISEGSLCRQSELTTGNTMDTPKASKKASRQDWHPADITAALRKAGWSYSQLALAHNYASKSALCNALRDPYPKAERIIAKAIGVQPMEIWPSRYDAAGQPNRTTKKPLRPAGHHPVSVEDRALPRNTQRKAA